MRELLLLRHAKSSWDDQSLADHQRPLNKRGRRDAPRMGAMIHQQKLLPELVLCSDSMRTRETVQLLIDAANCEAEIRFMPELYHASAKELLECSIMGGASSRLMLVAHNPGMEDLYEMLSGEHEPFPTAALAAFRLDIQDWSEVSPGVDCELIGLWRPKELLD